MARKPKNKSINAINVACYPSGNVLDLLNPCPGDIELTDVAYHLSLINRWSRTTFVNYSVAAHCLVGTHLLARLMTRGGYEEFDLSQEEANAIFPQALRFESSTGLDNKKEVLLGFMLHNAPEYVLGDLNEVIRRFMIQEHEGKSISPYEKLIRRMEGAISNKFGISTSVFDPKTPLGGVIEEMDMFLELWEKKTSTLIDVFSKGPMEPGLDRDGPHPKVFDWIDSKLYSLWQNKTAEMIKEHFSRQVEELLVVETPVSWLV